MKTVNSLSGGKTSSYMAAHYPADYEIFSLVTIEDSKCSPKDKKLTQMVSDKIGKEFIATAEDDLTLRVMFDLEQLIGREIIWVAGDTFEQVIKKQGGILPNIMLRFCTQNLKMKVIFEWWQKEINEIVKMRCGFRMDEKERAERFTTSFRTIIGKSKNGNRNKWGDIVWREGDFPLIDNKIYHYDVKVWADKTNMIFPSDSNCVGCFHKPLQQLRKNWDDNPSKMQWFADQEKLIKNGTKKLQWKKESSYLNIKKLGLQQDFFFGTGAGCQSGFCTD
jgi:hypothetical protein